MSLIRRRNNLSEVYATSANINKNSKPRFSRWEMKTAAWPQSATVHLVYDTQKIGSVMTNWIDSQMTQPQTSGQVFRTGKNQQDDNSATQLRSVCLWQNPCSIVPANHFGNCSRKAKLFKFAARLFCQSYNFAAKVHCWKHSPAPCISLSRLTAAASRGRDAGSRFLRDDDVSEGGIAQRYKLYHTHQTYLGGIAAAGWSAPVGHGARNLGLMAGKLPNSYNRIHTGAGLEVSEGTTVPVARKIEWSYWNL